jgi:hypothetical protein
VGKGIWTFEAHHQMKMTNLGSQMKKCLLFFLLLNDPTLKGPHVSSFTCVSIKHEELYDSRTLIGS